MEIDPEPVIPDIPDKPVPQPKQCSAPQPKRCIAPQPKKKPLKIKKKIINYKQKYYFQKFKNALKESHCLDLDIKIKQKQLEVLEKQLNN